MSAIFILTSCGGDDVDCSDEAALNATLENGADRVTNALLAYSMDPSDANCNTLKDTYSDWIDDLSSLQDCADDVGQGAEFRSAIADARTAIDDIPC